MPSERAFRRKIERDIDPVVVIFKREGSEALRQTLPSLQRSVAGHHAMEMVNIDGHNGTWSSGGPMARSRGRSRSVSRTSTAARCSPGRLARWRARSRRAWRSRTCSARYGIPRGLLSRQWPALREQVDHRRRRKSRFRFKICDEERLGLLTQLGIENYWTKLYRGQSKPTGARLARFPAGQHRQGPGIRGRLIRATNPTRSPELRQQRRAAGALPRSGRVGIAAAQCPAWPAHRNGPRPAQPGRGVRRTLRDCSDRGQMTLEKMRLALLKADDAVMANGKTGAVKLHGNLYWHEDLVLVAGQRVTVRFDPDDLHAPVHVYARDTGEYLCSAPVEEAVGFDNVAGARRPRREADYKKAVRPSPTQKTCSTLPPSPPPSKDRGGGGARARRDAPGAAARPDRAPAQDHFSDGAQARLVTPLRPSSWRPASARAWGSRARSSDPRPAGFRREVGQWAGG